jgi:hypothetical protein
VDLRNITITLDERTARWTRIQAARREVSVSRFIRELLEAEMRHEDEYEVAMREFLAEAPQALSRPGDRYPSRDELYDRDGLR